MASRRARHVSTLLIVLSSTGSLVGCGGGDGDVEEGSAAVAPPTAPVAVAPVDHEAPIFDGPVRVELVGSGVYRLSWEAAVDNRTAPAAIRYRVDHAVEPFAHVDDDREPIVVTEPGATEVLVTLDRPSGRFWVRAVDELDNWSEPAGPIAQRSRIPWVHADGVSLATYTHCVRDMSEVICVGSDGQAARWDGMSWQTLAAAEGVDLHAIETAGGIYVFSGAGHLWKYDHDNGLVPVDVGFVGTTPTIPFRDFGADQLGLNYWIDSAGVAWVGVPGLYRSTRSPLAIPDLAGCARLRDWWFGRTTAIAICQDGSVYSTSTQEAGMRWSPITSTTPWEFDQGIRNVLVPAEAGGVVVDPTGLRRVGVGGWQPLLEAGLDRAPVAGGFAFSRVNAVETLADGSWMVATDAGILQGDGAAWTAVAAPAGDVVGLLPRGLGEIDAVYANATVATLASRSSTWRVEPRPAGFVAATTSSTGDIYALTSGDDAALYRWAAGWVRVADAPPPSATLAPTAFASSDGSSIFAAYVNAESAVEIWRYAAGRWSTTGVGYPAPPPTPRPDDPPAPPPPLAAVEARRAVGGAPLMQPIVDIDIAPDGRALAVAANQAWWLVGNTWVLVGQRTSTIVAGAVDAGDTYVIVEDGGVTRCWRDRCQTGLTPVADAPSSVVRVWRAERGLTVLDANGALHAFARSNTPPPPDALDPGANTPPGGFIEIAPASQAVEPAAIRGRFTTADLDVVWAADGRVMRRAGERWDILTQRDDIIGLFAQGPSWALLTPVGLLAPADVPVATWQR